MKKRREPVLLGRVTFVTSATSKTLDDGTTVTTAGDYGLKVGDLLYHIPPTRWERFLRTVRRTWSRALSRVRFTYQCWRMRR